MFTNKIIIILLFFMNAVTPSFTNTTDFWKQTLKVQTIFYQCYSGYEEIDWYYPSGKSAMYYSMFGATRHSPTVPDARVPLILWLQGGPGASSQFGAFVQNGPIKISSNQISQNTNSWNIMGHLVYIDQPLGVGFSFATDKTKGRISSSYQSADHLLNFLYNFYRQWPALKISPLYITGESYAGHYIPAFALKLMDNVTFLNETKIVLEGIAIGDGWTDPYDQVNHYDSYLYSVGVVSNRMRDVCTWFQTQSIINMMRQDYHKSTSFINFLMNDNQTDTQNKYFGGMSVFNFRRYQDLDVSFSAFLNESRRNFGVPEDIHFFVSSEEVQNAFAEDLSRSYQKELILLLKQNVRVIYYNGQEDYIVNTPGVLNFLNSLNWVGIEDWKLSKKQIWKIHGQVKGWAKVNNNLWFVLVNKAGHMVPADQPEAAFNMMGHFIFDSHDWKS